MLLAGAIFVLTLVLEILTASQKGAFVKEDGEPVIDAAGQRVK